MADNFLKYATISILACSALTSCAKAITTNKTNLKKQASVERLSEQNSSLNAINSADRGIVTSSIHSKHVSNPNLPWTIENAVHQAVRWHPAITERVGHLREQEAKISEARSGYLPSISWGVDGVSQNSSQQSFNPNINVGVSQVLYDFGKVDSRVAIATAGKLARRSEILVAVDDLARETSSAFIEILRNKALANVATDQVADTQAIATLVDRRREKGASTQSDVYQAEARVQAAKATMTEISGEIMKWRSVLSSLTGHSDFDLDPKIPPFLKNACHNDNIKWGELPSVIKANADETAAKSQITLARAEGLPTLSLDIGADLDPLGYRSNDLDYTIGLKVKGSLYNGGATNARRLIAERSLSTLKATKDRIKLEISRNLAEARSQIASKENLTKSLERRQETMRLTRELYEKQYIELGTRTLLDLLNAAQERHAARLDKINIEFDLLRLNLDCLYNTGGSRDAFRLQGAQVQGIAI